MSEQVDHRVAGSIRDAVRTYWPHVITVLSVGALVVEGSFIINANRSHDRAQETAEIARLAGTVAMLDSLNGIAPWADDYATPPTTIGTKEDTAAKKAALSDRITTLSNVLGDIAKDPQDGTPLALESTPGYRNRLSTGQVERHDSSTVHLTSTNPNSDEPPRGSCSGNIIKDGDDAYVLTARHCFGGKDVFPDNMGTNGHASYISSVNTFGGRSYWMNIQPLSYPLQPQGIAVLNASDVALMSAPYDAGAFRAVGIDPLSTRNKLPKPGAEASLISYPQAAGFKKVTNRGRYLGVARDPNRPGTKVWTVWVGVNPLNEQKDPCNYGSSGSSAVIGREGFVTGPLSSMIRPLYPGERTDASFSDKDALQAKERLGQALGVDATKFATICSYTLVTPDQLAMSTASLQIGEALEIANQS